MQCEVVTLEHMHLFFNQQRFYKNNRKKIMSLNLYDMTPVDLETGSARQEQFLKVKQYNVKLLFLKVTSLMSS